MYRQIWMGLLALYIFLWNETQTISIFSSRGSSLVVGSQILGGSTVSWLLNSSIPSSRCWRFFALYATWVKIWRYKVQSLPGFQQIPSNWAFHGIADPRIVWKKWELVRLPCQSKVEPWTVLSLRSGLPANGSASDSGPKTQTLWEGWPAKRVNLLERVWTIPKWSNWKNRCATWQHRTTFLIPDNGGCPDRKPIHTGGQIREELAMKCMTIRPFN